MVWDGWIRLILWGGGIKLCWGTDGRFCIIWYWLTLLSIACILVVICSTIFFISKKWFSVEGDFVSTADLRLSAFLSGRCWELSRCCWELSPFGGLGFCFFSGSLCVPFKCGKEHSRLKQDLFLSENLQRVGWKYLHSLPFLHPFVPFDPNRRYLLHLGGCDLGQGLSSISFVLFKPWGHFPTLYLSQISVSLRSLCPFSFFCSSYLFQG